MNDLLKRQHKLIQIKTEKSIFSLFYPMPSHPDGYLTCMVRRDQAEHFLKMGFYLEPKFFPQEDSSNAKSQKNGRNENHDPDKIENGQGQARHEHEQDGDGARRDSETPQIIDGDKGDGCRPNSPEWHKKAVRSMKNKMEIIDYIHKLFQERLAYRNTVEQLVEKADKVIDAKWKQQQAS